MELLLLTEYIKSYIDNTQFWTLKAEFLMNLHNFLYCEVDGSNSLLKMLTEDPKKWTVRAYGRNISPSIV